MDRFSASPLVFGVVTGFAPLFLVVQSAIQGLSVAILIIVVMLLTGLIMGLFRHFVVFEAHILLMYIVLAGLSGVLALLLAANYYGLYRMLGSYLPLLACNGFIFSCVQYGYLRYGLYQTLRLNLSAALFILIFFSLFGFIRELLLHASLLRHFDPASGLLDVKSGLGLIEDFVGGAVFANHVGVLFILAFLLAAGNYLASLLPATMSPFGSAFAPVFPRAASSQMVDQYERDGDGRDDFLA